MRITTEKRLERLEAADGRGGVAYVALDTLPDDDGADARIMTEEQWEAVYCGAEKRR